MADLSTTFAGIKSPNPFWLASAPPTDKEYNVRRAFEAGWGGVVWKTLGEDGPPIVNVNGPRYESLFAELGAERVTALDFDTRRDAEEPSRLARLLNSGQQQGYQHGYANAGRHVPHWICWN